MSRVGFSSFLLAKKKISFSILLRYILTIYYFDENFFFVGRVGLGGDGEDHMVCHSPSEDR